MDGPGYNEDEMPDHLFDIPDDQGDRDVDFYAPDHDEPEHSTKRVKVELKDSANVVENPDSIDYSVWKRPALPPGGVHELVKQTGSLSFMQVDVDDYVEKPHARWGNKESALHNPEAPILRMYGISKEGHSIMAHIHGFLPYFYCPVGNCTDAKIFQDSLEQVLVNARAANNIKKNVSTPS